MMEIKELKPATLFSRLKAFINDRTLYTKIYYKYAKPSFTTKELRAAIGHYEKLTYWKRSNNNPNYTLHIYLGELRRLGAITRIGHGHYEINAPIPEWFGSFHFSGLKGKLEDKCNLYWNNLPAEHKVNPWSNNTQQSNKTSPMTNTIESRVAKLEAAIKSVTKRDNSEDERQDKLYTFTQTELQSLIATIIKTVKDELIDEVLTDKSSAFQIEDDMVDFAVQGKTIEVYAEEEMIREAVADFITETSCEEEVSIVLEECYGIEL